MSLTSIIILLHSIVTLINFIALYVMLNRRLELQQRYATYMLFGTVLANCGMLVEVYSKGILSTIMLGRSVQAAGTAVVVLAILLFSAQVCQVALPPMFTRIIMFLDVVVICIHFLDIQYGTDWFYKSVSAMVCKGYRYASTDYGFLGYLFWIVCVFIPVLAAIGMLFYSAFQDKNKYRRKEHAMVGIIILSIILVLASHYFLGVSEPYQPGMAWATLLFSAMAFSKWRTQGLDLVSQAAKSAVDNVDYGVIVANQYQELIYANQAMKNILPTIDKYLGSTVESIKEFNLNYLRQGEKLEILFEDRRYMVSISGITDEKEDNFHGFAVIFNDMTEMLAMMERLKVEQHKAEAAADAKQGFLTNISHEIRTPMNAIVGLSELIIEESRGRKVYDMAVTIKRASMNLLNLVNNILDYSKLDAGEMELLEDAYSLKELVNDIEGVMRIPAAQRGITVKIDLDENLPDKLNGDSGKIRQILINLMNNGIKFTKEGYVKLRISGRVREDNLLLTFMVIDTGIGIKEEDIGRIFGSFEHGDKINNKSIEGTGLGLSICQELVNLLGGSLDVFSVYKEGTTFTLHLAQQILSEATIADVKAEEDAKEEEERMFVAPDIKALIVDDNKVNIMVAQNLMSQYQLQIDTARSGQEAIDMVSAKDYDIIMMDHMMPEMDGVETTKRIRKLLDPQGKNPVIVALTANTFSGVEDMFLSHGFDDYMSKPVEKKAMYKMLLSIIPASQRHFVDAIITEAAYTEDELAELFLEGVDVRSAVDERDGSIPAYLQLLELYLLEGREKYKDMQVSYQERDWKNYGIIVHGMKSTSANIGATFLSEQAKKHELAANECDEAFIDSDQASLAEKYKALLDDIETLLEKRKSNGKPSGEEKKDALSSEDLIKAVEDIIQLSEDFQTKEAAEKIEELLSHKLDDYSEKMLQDIRMKYKLYDDDGAEDLLHQLVDKLKENT